ncbi:MAG: gliding motility-associated C-terminal domain-containing protein [Bacteroidetes bacterium]|nr:gliding motility-associated C-terminal domain-containing protein [Bacteroidota bacterium]
MKIRLRHIIIWLTLFGGTNIFASHILGGEISYKHIKKNEYKVTLNIYRDCNGCKINGYGGGSTSENCSEIDYIYVKTNDDTASKEVKFALKRESIADISPVCRTKISNCLKNSNTIFGTELQTFSATVDLDNEIIKGFCKYIVYIVIAERNSNITTGQAKQNFCIDAMINICAGKVNNSPDFISKPTFIYNSNKAVYQTFGTTDNDNDSLVYTLTPALTGLNKEAKYNSGFSFNKPLSFYCPENPCLPDKNASIPIGFYFDSNTGENVFVPVSESERAVIAVKIEDYKYISGKWILAGYIKRDIQIYVKSNEGNNSPVFTSKNKLEVCEDEEIELKITAKDDKNPLTGNYDSILFAAKNKPENSDFLQYTQTDPPYRYAVFKWKAPKVTENSKTYSVHINATDNNCPLNFTSYQNLTIKVYPKINLKIVKNNLGCGNYEIKAQDAESYSNYELKIFDLKTEKQIFSTAKLTDTISNLLNAKYLIKAQITNNYGCVTNITDTINNYYKSISIIKGDSVVCKDLAHQYIVTNNIHQYAQTNWYFENNFIGNGTLTTSFNQNGSLKAISNYQKGKWNCSDTLLKTIEIMEQTEIISPDKIYLCHNTGFFDLSKIEILPQSGTWSSNSSLLVNNFINTNDSFPYKDDSLTILYKVKNSNGCESVKKIDIKIKEIPEFELSSITICENSTAIWLNNLIKKPYKKLDYNYNWKIYGYNGIIKEVNGNKYVLSSDLGLGIHKLSAKITGKNSCQNYDSTIIEITPTVNIKLENEIELCQNTGIVDLNKISGITPSTGTWSFFDFPLFTDKNHIKTDTCGVFEAIYIYDNYGCYDSKKINIKIACSPKISSNIESGNYCENKLPFKLEALPANGTWESKFVNSENIFNPPETENTTTYNVKYTINYEKCLFEKNIKLTILPSPKLKIVSNKDEYCHNEPIILNGKITKADNFKATYYSKTWNFENISRVLPVNDFEISQANFYNSKPLKSQKITLSVFNIEGCTDSLTLDFNVLEAPQILNFGDTSYCEKPINTILPSVKYNGSKKLMYHWENNGIFISNQKEIKSSALLPGINSLKLVVSDGMCRDDKLANITINHSPYVDFMVIPAETVSILNSELEFINLSENNLNFLWNFGTKQSNNTSTEKSLKFKFNDTGTYYVKLKGTNALGCYDYFFKEIKIIPEVLIFVPNAFSPNNKGVDENNTFGVTINHYSQFKISIFDRWGHKVYYSENASERWDGKSGEVKCPTDIYFYNIEILSVSGNTYKYRGTITLIK